MNNKDSILSFIKSSPLFTKTRIPSLYSDFRRLEDSNPEGYEANLAAWKTLLTTYFEAKIQNGSASIIQLISEETILQPLSSPDNGIPLAIDLAIDSLISSGYLIPLSNHLKCLLPKNIAMATKNQGDQDQGGSSSVALNAFKWVFRKTAGLLLFSPHETTIYPTIRGSKGPGSLRSERFVVRSALVEYSMRINKDYLKRQITHGYIESIYSWGLFYDEVNRLFETSWLSKLEVLSILAHLYQTKVVTVDYQDLDESEAEDFEKHIDNVDALGENSNLVIKFNMTAPLPVVTTAAQNSNNNNNKDIIKLNAQQRGIMVSKNRVTAQDKAVARLRDTHMVLQNRIKKLAILSKQASEKARESVKHGGSNSNNSRTDMVIAKYALKSRNITDRALENAIGQLENLDQLIGSIDAAINMAQVTDALSQGVNIIRGINDQIGGIERVNRIVQETEEGIESVKEMEETIGSVVNNAVDDAEVMDELDQLEREKLQLQRAEQSSPDALADNLADRLASLELTVPLDLPAKGENSKMLLPQADLVLSETKQQQKDKKGKEPAYA